MESFEIVDLKKDLSNLDFTRFYEYETENNLFLGLMEKIKQDKKIPEQTYFKAFFVNGIFKTFFFRTDETTPFIFGYYPKLDFIESEIDFVLTDILKKYPLDTLKVLGEKNLVEKLSTEFSKKNGLKKVIVFSERVHELKKVELKKDFYIPQIQQISKKDREQVLKMFRDFTLEALPQEVVDEKKDVARFEIMVKNISLEFGYGYFENENLVALTVCKRPTQNSASITYVYTIPEFRGQGLAGLVVCRISQEILNSGKKKVTLFTDLANPISNHLYAKIGFKPVLDLDLYRFEKK